MRKTFKLSYPVIGLMMALLWLFPAPVDAAIYKWKDDQGKTHFTDDKSKIPLKYREQLEKFKGVAEPKPEPVEEPVESEKEKEAVAVEPEAGEGNGGGEPPKKKKNVELIAMLKETIQFLEDENRTHQRLLNFVKPDVQNGRYYIVPIRKGVNKKEQFVKKLKGFKHPSLKRAGRFLKNSLFRDRQEKIGGDGYLERILDLKQRLEREIKTKKKIIKRLQSDLDEEDK